MVPLLQGLFPQAATRTVVYGRKLIGCRGFSRVGAQIDWVVTVQIVDSSDSTLKALCRLASRCSKQT